MANRKLNSIKFPDIADTYILDAGKVEYHETDTFEEDTVGKALQNKANIDGSYDSMTVGNAEQLVSNVRVNDKTPYLFRTSGGSVDIGDREYVGGIVGGTIAWNQLVRSILTQTKYGIDCTNNGDGSYTFNNTSTARAQFFLNGDTIHMNANDKILVCANRISGTCSNTFDMFWYFEADDGSGTTYPSMVVISSDGTIHDTAKIFSMSKSGTMSLNGVVLDFPYTGTVTTSFKVTPQVYNLTQMFGSTIADYIYSLETANAGAGVAWFKKLFNKPYYAYNAGELKHVSGLVSHDMTGFNQWDEVWELGYLDAQGAEASSTNNIRSKFFDLCIGGVTYCIYNGTSTSIKFYEYDADKNYVDNWSCNAGTSRIVTTSGNTRYFKICTSAGVTTYNNDICINLAWDNSRNGEYEPYELHSYPLDSSLTLRGIPKLDANNNLYYDGDVYEADGTVTRKYAYVDLGSLTWAGSSSNGYSATFTNLKYVVNNVLVNAICAPFQAVTKDYWTANPSVNNIFRSDNSDPILYFRAQSYADATAFKTAMNGVYLVYELATPTTEEADAYQQTQIVNDFGTEEYVIDSNTFAVPVGSDTDYPVNLVAKLEMAPNSPEGNGDYIVRQTNGTNEYVPLVIEDALPTIPSTAGSYKLTVTVVEGSDPVLSWEAE